MGGSRSRGAYDADIACSRKDLECYLASICSGALPAEVLRNKRSDTLVARVRLGDAGSAIVKVFRRRGLRGALRRVSRTDPARRERRAILHLRKAGLNVPRVIGDCRISAPSGVTQALFLEDLGECRTGIEYVAQLIREGEEHALRAFEDGVIDLTARMLEAGRVDSDHTMLNVIVRPGTNEPVRVDFECCKYVGLPRLFPRSRVKMLGRLIATYVYAVQPDARRAVEFARRLADRLKPSARVLRGVSENVQWWMEEQRRAVGIDTRVSLQW